MRHRIRIGVAAAAVAAAYLSSYVAFRANGRIVRGWELRDNVEHDFAIVTPNATWLSVFRPVAFVEMRARSLLARAPRHERSACRTDTWVAAPRA